MKKRSFKKIIIGLSIITGVTAIVVGIIKCTCKRRKNIDKNDEYKNPFEGKKVVFVENENDPENADGVRGHLEILGEAEHSASFYDKYIKRALDIVISSCGIVILSPLLIGLSIAIFIDDPGPVFFTQKRVGRNKRFFKLHKFRSMKMCTPHDVPTHMLTNPEQYITRVGKFIRKHSLDELPQIFDIFVGSMSVIGPRPGLWNQDVLTAERDKYGANDVKPGLTGWAQINGRDELEIPEKARLDGEYVAKESFIFDAKCFIGSIGVFAHDDTVIEGGTSAIYNQTDMPFMAVCHKNLDFSQKKRILIAGKGSYIGESFKRYMEQFKNYTVDSFETTSDEWKKMDFSGYEVVYDVAGIAHIKETDSNRHLYYEVNCDLAVEIADKARKAGVKQFIYLSSMSVYGMISGKINERTTLNPVNAYGKSKLEAEEKLWKLKTNNFVISIVRPPMVYGYGCKGNYQLLRKFALRVGFFPKYNNERSMIYVDNLSSAVRGIIHNAESGVYFPQNIDYVRTYDMVKAIAENNFKKFHTVTIFNYPIKIAAKLIGIFKKVFGSLTYDQNMNVPDQWIDVKSNAETYSMAEHYPKYARYDSDSKDKKILVLMSTYNGEKYIEEQIRSIIKQKTDANVYIKIRDDGSTDGTCDIIEKLTVEYPNRIELQKGHNIGYNASFFRLLCEAEGYDYYAISDQDDVWLKDKLETAIYCLEQETEKDIPLLYASTSYLVRDDLVPYGTTRKQERPFAIYNTIIQNICPGHTQVMNNQLLNMVRDNLDVSRIYVYDSWIMNMAMLYGKILFDNESHTLYRQHSGNQLGSGRGAFGQLISSLKKTSTGDGRKYKEQIMYFVQKNGAELAKKGCFNELKRFIDADTLLKRLKYSLTGKLYRQKKQETFAFYLAVILGKY